MTLSHVSWAVDQISGLLKCILPYMCGYNTNISILFHAPTLTGPVIALSTWNIVVSYLFVVPWQNYCGLKSSEFFGLRATFPGNVQHWFNPGVGRRFLEDWTATCFIDPPPTIHTGASGWWNLRPSYMPDRGIWISKIFDPPTSCNSIKNCADRTASSKGRPLVRKSDPQPSIRLYAKLWNYDVQQTKIGSAVNLRPNCLMTYIFISSAHSIWNNLILLRPLAVNIQYY